MRRTIACGAALLALAGCRLEGRRGRQDASTTPSAPRRNVLGLLAGMDKSVLRDTTGTEEAQHREYTTFAAPDSVRGYFRRQFDSLGWAIQGDQAASGQATMYATKDSDAVWLRVWSDSGVTWYALIGTTIRGPQPGPTQPSMRGRGPGPRTPRP